MTATVDLVDIRRAAERVAGIAVATPLITSAWLNRRTGAQVVLKAENAQRSGAFKFRGAVNAMLAMPPARLAHGVVAGSSGNHGRGVALAASLLGTTAVAVMPRDAPASKCEAVRRLGTRIVRYDRFTEDRDLIVERVAREERRTVIPSAADPLVISAAGTIVVEMVGDWGDLDVLVAPVGGGGLVAGCAMAAIAMCRSVRVIGVEPRSGDDTLRSLAAGRRIRIEPPVTIADGLCQRTPPELTFRLNQRLLDRVVLVSDTEIANAMRFLLEVEGLMVEPSGACALAALLAGRVPLTPRIRIGVVISGGNIDPELARCLVDTLASPTAGAVW